MLRGRRKTRHLSRLGRIATLRARGVFFEFLVDHTAVCVCKFPIASRAIQARREPAPDGRRVDNVGDRTELAGTGQ